MLRVLYFVPILMIGHLVFSPMPKKPKIENAEPRRLPLVPLDEKQHGAFYNSLPSPQWAMLRDNALVLTNNTGKPIVSLVIQWSYFDAQGKPAKHTDWTDTLMRTDGQTVAAPGMSLVLIPGGHRPMEGYPQPTAG